MSEKLGPATLILPEGLLEQPNEYVAPEPKPGDVRTECCDYGFDARSLTPLPDGGKRMLRCAKCGSPVRSDGKLGQDPPLGWKHAP